MKKHSSKNSEAKKRSIGEIVLGLLLMGIFICELLIISWCRIQYTQIGYEITTANKKYDKLIATQKQLTVELARLKSPERLTGIAETSLGMQMPSSGQRVVVE
jgi:cell division protein FtsL